MVRKNQCFYPACQFNSASAPSPMVHHTEHLWRLVTWNHVKSNWEYVYSIPSCNVASTQERVYQIATIAGPTMCSMHFVPNPEDRTSPNLSAQISQGQILGWKRCFWAGDKGMFLMLNQLQIQAGYQLWIEAGSKLEFEAGLPHFLTLIKPCMPHSLHVRASF